MWIAFPLWESERRRSQLTRMCKCLRLNDCCWNLGLILSSFLKGYACQLLSEPRLLFSHFSAVIISKSRKSKGSVLYFWGIISLGTKVKWMYLWKPPFIPPSLFRVYRMFAGFSFIPELLLCWKWTEHFVGLMFSPTCSGWHHKGVFSALLCFSSH